MTQPSLAPGLEATDHEAADRQIRELERKSEQNLWACYQCGRCTADCPFSLTPSLAVRLLQLGQLDAARALATTWDCASCYSCQTGCPKGVSPARVMKALRALDGGQAPAVFAHPADLLGRNGDPLPLAPAATPRWAPRARLAAWTRRMRAHALASMPRAFPLMSAIAPLSNRMMRLPGARQLAHLVLGVHRDRQLPSFATQSFPAWFARHQPLGDGHRGTVVLFHDEFMDYNYPQTGIAVTEILERAGYRVELFRGACCGRPMISKGFEDGASVCAVKNVPILHEAASQGVYIVGCEPSCLLTLRDEYLHLVPQGLEAQARVVARQAFLIDEFLVMLHAKGELELTFRPPDTLRPVLFHGHCHQKAFADASKSVELLGIAGYDVEYINAACCGMAGLHGFEKRHFEASRAACERSVLPAVRSRPDADLVIMGVSCRQQIEQFSARPVRHLVEAVRDAIA